MGYWKEQVITMMHDKGCDGQCDRCSDVVPCHEKIVANAKRISRQRATIGDTLVKCSVCDSTDTCREISNVLAQKEWVLCRQCNTPQGILISEERFKKLLELERTE